MSDVIFHLYVNLLYQGSRFNPLAEPRLLGEIQKAAGLIAIGQIQHESPSVMCVNGNQLYTCHMLTRRFKKYDLTIVNKLLAVNLSDEFDYASDALSHVLQNSRLIGSAIESGDGGYYHHICSVMPSFGIIYFEHYIRESLINAARTKVRYNYYVRRIRVIDDTIIMSCINCDHLLKLNGDQKHIFQPSEYTFYLKTPKYTVRYLDGDLTMHWHKPLHKINTIGRCIKKIKCVNFMLCFVAFDDKFKIYSLKTECVIYSLANVYDFDIYGNYLFILHEEKLKYFHI
jgi:hypothetical protein